MPSDKQDNIQDGDVPSIADGHAVPGTSNHTPKAKMSDNGAYQEMRSDTVNYDVSGDVSASITVQDDPDIGASFTVMKLWEGRTSTDRLVWLTEPPAVKEEEQPASESPRYAITLLHRSNKSKESNAKQSLETIIIRSPELQKFLDDTIPKISSFYNESEHGLALRSPFRLLFWHLDHIETATRNNTDRALSRAAALLRDVLEEEFRSLLVKRSELIAKREMNFDVLWTLFKPGITCVTNYVDSIVAVKVSSIDFSHDPMGQLYYRINHTNLAWDGEQLGWHESYTDIMEFTGRRKIHDLDIFPIEFHGDTSLVERLTSRGKRFVELAVKEPHMMSFNGETLDRENSPMWWQGEQKKKLSERVILDARAYNHYYRRLLVSKWLKRGDLDKILTGQENPEQNLYLYCCPEFFCFALQRKKWARVWLDDLTDVTFNESAYPSLVLPHGYKDLLLAFAESQIDDAEYFDDVIAGKGQGILMLLAGPPGTGKTLTAEAVAEHMRRPLYSVSSGELGTSTGGMENALDKVLELSTRWNAVLLLDEADIFLVRRTDNDLHRNSIVSVFLRKLEYYRGIMFLTTNRIQSFDEAFKSRIHISIRYPDLDVSARKTIWGSFLTKAKDTCRFGVDVSADDIQGLAEMEINGREIRNIVKSAQLLAARMKKPLNKEHLNTVWRVEHEDNAWRDSSP